MALNVTVYDAALTPALTFTDKDETDVDFVSLVSGETYGPPALVAPDPKRGGPPTARPGDRVLYINTSVAVAWLIERLED